MVSIAEDDAFNPEVHTDLVVKHVGRSGIFDSQGSEEKDFN